MSGIGYRGKEGPKPELPEGFVRSRRAGQRTAVESGADVLDPWRQSVRVVGPRAPEDLAKVLATNGVFNVKDYGATGDGTTDDTVAMQDALDAAQAANGTLVFPPGTYVYSSLSNVGNTDFFEILGVGRVVLKHTGTGVGLDVNGDPSGLGTTGARSWGIQISNIMLEGNSNTSVGFRFKHTHHGRFKNLRVLNMSGSAGSQGFRLEWSVLNWFEDIIVTSNEENGAATLPETGLSIGAGVANSQGNIFLNVMFEGLVATGAVGIHVDNGHRNWFYGGTSEGNYQGISLDDGSTGNTFNGMYMEDNANEHVVDQGDWTQWINCLCDDLNGATFIIHANSQHVVVMGGEYGTMTIQAGANNSFLCGVSLNTLSNGGTNTGIINLWDIDGAAQSTYQFGSGLRFQPDNTHDIGQSGAARPRDLFVSRRVNAATDYQVAGTKVLGARDTGWTAMTGTANKATAYATSTITLIQLAERVKALQDAITTHGAIGA